MNYFKNLTIVDVNNQQFRNLFQKVLINYVRDDQLINYRISDFETIASIAYNFYGSADYWWVISLLNNIYDFNFDVPLPTEQLEYISEELAQNYRFVGDLISSGEATIGASNSYIDVEFDETSTDDNYVVKLDVKSPIADFTVDNYGYVKLSNTTFRIQLSFTTYNELNFTYAVFKTPSRTSATDIAKFTDYFDRLLREADAKRTIQLIKSEDIGNFVTNFLLAIQGRQTLIDVDVDEDDTYSQGTNFLVDLPDVVVPEHGTVVELKEDETFAGDAYFTELEIDNYEFNYQIHLTPKSDSVATAVSDLNSVGTYAVRSKLVTPRVYNTGTNQCGFEAIVFSPDHAEYSDVAYQSLQSGTSEFAGSGSHTEIVLENFTDITSEDDVGIMITPIIDISTQLSSIGKISYQAINKNTVRVYNTGDSGLEFFWNLYKLDYFYFVDPGLIPDVTIVYAGSASQRNISFDISATTTDEIAPIITPVYSTFDELTYIGDVGVKFGSVTDASVYNAGSAGNHFAYEFQNATLYGDIVTGGSAAFTNIAVPADPSIITTDDLCIGLIPLVSTDATDLHHYGARGIKINSVTSVDVYNLGNASLPLRWFQAQPLTKLGETFHGTETFAGGSSYTTITIATHDDIKNKDYICLLITPIVTGVSDLENIGDFAFEAISPTEIRVYNTGTSGINFKWVVTSRTLLSP